MPAFRSCFSLEPCLSPAALALVAAASRGCCRLGQPIEPLRRSRTPTLDAPLFYQLLLGEIELAATARLDLRYQLMLDAARRRPATSSCSGARPRSRCRRAPATRRSRPPLRVAPGRCPQSPMRCATRSSCCVALNRVADVDGAALAAR